MKTLLAAFVILMTACSTLPPEGSLARLKHDGRRALTADCMKSPELYGFPYTRAENADLAGLNPGLAPNVYTHCKRVAEINYGVRIAGKR